MQNIFLVSDTHFSHANICKFTKDDGTKLRPWNDVDEMNEDMVKFWNETVRPEDKVYHLGDVVINKKHLHIMERLNGTKVLIKGNHDTAKLADYMQYFKDIRAYHALRGLIFSHIPVHEGELRRFGCNIHGHLHQARVMKDGDIDPRYFNVSVEHTNFRPILLEEVKNLILEQGGEIGLTNGNF